MGKNLANFTEEERKKAMEKYHILEGSVAKSEKNITNYYFNMVIFP